MRQIKNDISDKFIFDTIIYSILNTFISSISAHAPIIQLMAVGVYEVKGMVLRRLETLKLYGMENEL